MVVFRIAGTDFAVPVEGETYLVQLFAIAVDIVDGGDCGMLSRLYGIMFGQFVEKRESMQTNNKMAVAPRWQPASGRP